MFSSRPGTGRGWEAPTYDGIDDQLDDARSRLTRLTARAAYQEVLYERAVLVDIRPAAQRQQEGEVDPRLRPLVIERNVLEWRLDPRSGASLPVADLDRRVIVLCQEGYTSSLAADALVRLGLHRATDVVGGLAALAPRRPADGLTRYAGSLRRGGSVGSPVVTARDGRRGAAGWAEVAGTCTWTTAWAGTRAGRSPVADSRRICPCAHWSSRRRAPASTWSSVPSPTVGPDDVKIRVLRAGLCGTDLHLEQWDDWAASTVTAPLVIGHEFFGEVVEVGAAVTAVSVGRPASGEGHIVCGTCRNCRAGRRHLCIHTISVGVNRDGAFADYVVDPRGQRLGAAATTSTPTSAPSSTRSATPSTPRCSFPLVGEDVLITGAGPIGVMAAAIARHAGARYVVVTDVSDYRLDLARQAGRRPGDQRLAHQRRRRPAPPRHAGGLRHRPGDVAAARRPWRTCSPTSTTARAVAMLGLPKDPFADRLGPGHHAHDHHQGHLRPGDVRHLVRHVLDAPDERAAARRRQLGHHAPLPGRELAGGLRRRPLRASAARSSSTGR